MGTETLRDETPTPTATNTATATATLTATPTLTSSPTTTPKPSSTLTATSVPQTATPTLTLASFPQVIIFQDNFDNGLNNGVASREHWNAPQIKQFGGKVEIVPDPTNSVDSLGNPRGNAMKATTGTAVPLNWGPGLWQAIYPNWEYFHTNHDGYSDNIPGSSGIQVDVWVDPSITGFSVVSGHIKAPSSNFNPVGGLEYHKGNVTVVAAEGGKYSKVNCIEGLLKPGWNTWTIIDMIDSEKKISRMLPFINGKFGLRSTEEAPTISYTGGTFFDAHAGINFNSPPNGWPMIPPGLVVLNDNFKVFTTTVNTDQ
ncbi:MAG: hypothetical protein KGJ80_09840 [Chloroflexota bacterium]|nr:hypothetical protein [Chloroflexota bacterium]